MSLDNWKMSTSQTGPPYGVLSYVESQDSGDISISDENSNVITTYQIDDDAIVSFLNDLKGYPTYANEPVGDFTIQRQLPEQHPVFSNFFVTDVSAKRIRVDGTYVLDGPDPNGGVVPSTRRKTGQWVYDKVTARFQPPNYAVLSDAAITVGGVQQEIARYVTRTYNYVSETLTVDAVMKFVTRFAGLDSPSKAKEAALKSAPGFVVSYLEKEMTWYSIPARVGNATRAYSALVPPNVVTVLSLAGTLNSTCFDGNPPGTCLFAGYQPRLKKPILSNGLYTWDLTYRFLVKDGGTPGVEPNVVGGNCDSPLVSAPVHAGPNYIYDTLMRRYDLITANGLISGPRLYSYADHNLLFQITEAG